MYLRIGHSERFARDFLGHSTDLKQDPPRFHNRDPEFGVSLAFLLESDVQGDFQLAGVVAIGGLVVLVDPGVLGTEGLGTLIDVFKA